MKQFNYKAKTVAGRRFCLLFTVCHHHFKNYLTLRHLNETSKHYCFSERFILDSF